MNCGERNIMVDNEINTVDKGVLEKLVEYCKYLYEEEKARTIGLNNAVKVYIAFLTITLGMGVFGVLPVERISILLNGTSIDSTYKYVKVSGVVLFYVSVLLFFSSFIFTILVLKVWKFERLCNPKQTALKSVFIETENKMLSVIIADYVIAANRNYEINEKKAKLLSKALFSLVGGLILFSISWFILNGLILL